ncbi:MAG: thioredoxin-like domain-containing protein [Acidimicrobiia bacterium]
MNKLFLIAAALAVVVAACTSTSQEPSTTTSVASEDNTAAEIQTTTTGSKFQGQSYAGTLDAPEFPTGLDWINTDQPLSLNDLKGKVVLLDFWTYGCINCIHIIPDLERLEHEYPDELVVVGVHSAKFTNESETENLKDIVQRYGVIHPVVNDKNFEIWETWGVSAWPTVALIDPTSRAVGTRSGEGVYDALKPIIASLVAEFDGQGAISREPIPLAPEADSAPERPLSYPGKVLAQDGRLWVADTGHNRVLEVDPSSGDVLAAYGSGVRGSDDGASLEATFNAPQGLAVVGTTLYVADTNNHLIRAVDLSSGQVSTVAGTGKQGWPPETGASLEIGLSNPWDIVHDNGLLYIANAGTHQIWVADLANETVGPLIGNSRESTKNDTFESAELAQPSGLALSDAGLLYFADSESSAIRVGDLVAQRTDLVVGADADLFSFGDVDGTGNEARLQHPLGVALSGSTLYVADTYNSKIKRVNTTSNTITSWLGGESGWADGIEAAFNEPGGLSVDDGLLYVADTNNHSVRVIDTATGNTSTLVLKGIETFDPPSTYRGDEVMVPAVTGAVGPASLVLDYTLPEGYKVNEEAPSSVVVSSGESLLSLASAETGDITGTNLPVELGITLHEGTGTATLDVTLIYCENEALSLCLIDQARFEVPLTVGPPGESSQIVLTRTIVDPTL